MKLLESLKEITVPLGEYKRLVRSELVLENLKALLETDKYISSKTIKAILGMEEETTNESL